MNQYIETWTVSGSMQHPNDPNRRIDGFNLYLKIKGEVYCISSKELEQYKESKHEDTKEV